MKAVEKERAYEILQFDGTDESITKVIETASDKGLSGIEYYLIRKHEEDKYLKIDPIEEAGYWEIPEGGYVCISNEELWAGSSEELVKHFEIFPETRAIDLGPNGVVAAVDIDQGSEIIRDDVYEGESYVEFNIGGQTVRLPMGIAEALSSVGIGDEEEEEHSIEKLDIGSGLNSWGQEGSSFRKVANKVNEIIDYLRE